MIAAIGDLHLGKLAHIIPDSVTKQLATLDSALAGIASRGCEHCVLLGDVTDTPYPTQETLRALLDVLTKHDLTYHVIAGNHDMAGVDTSSLALVEWLGKRKLLRATVYTKPTLIKIDGLKCWMCPHPYVESPPKKVDFCFGHFAWTGAKRDNGTIEKGGRVPKTGTWLLGDFHTHAVDKRYTYAGSLTQLSFAEKLPKGYLLIDGRNVSFERIKPAYILEKVIIRDKRDLKQLKPSRYYVAALAQGFRMPADWQTRYPNIVRVDSHNKAKAGDRAAAVNAFEFTSPLDGLEEWLKTRGKLKPPQIKWSVGRAERMRQSIHA